MLIPGDEFSLHEGLIKEALATGCFYCRRPIVEEQLPIVYWYSGEVNIFLHDGCAQGLGVHLIADGYRSHDAGQLHVHDNGRGPDGCVQCDLFSNLQAVGERRPGGPVPD